MKVKPLKGKVLVANMEKGERMVRGFIVPNDNGKSEGIRSRWAQVYAVGPDVKEIRPGQWVLIDQMRWTRSVKIEENGKELELWQIEWPDGAALVSDEYPGDEAITFSKWA